MVYVFLAEGFEEIEALAPIDILRRAGVAVTTVSIVPDEAIVWGAHNIPVLADCTLAEVEEEADMLVLPGGLPGATNLDACEPLREMIMAHYKAGKPLAAICAAPLVYGHLGILKGVKATCYPGFEKEMEGAEYTATLVEEDGQFITGCGPAAAMEFGYRLAARLVENTTVDALREGMQYLKLVKN